MLRLRVAGPVFQAMVKIIQNVHIGFGLANWTIHESQSNPLASNEYRRHISLCFLPWYLWNINYKRLNVIQVILGNWSKIGEYTFIPTAIQLNYIEIITLEVLFTPYIRDMCTRKQGLELLMLNFDGLSQGRRAHSRALVSWNGKKPTLKITTETIPLNL